MTNSANITDIVNEGISAIEADTPELESEIGAYHNLIHALVKKGNITPSQFSEAMAEAFSDDLNEPDPDELIRLTEGYNVKDFITQHQ